MGVLNVTPDSFSDGGRYADVPSATEHGLAMWADGADVVDVGGESTRPGADPVTAEEELRRVLPVVSALAREGVRVSIDTTKPEVAEACLGAGAWMVNDVTAAQSEGMAEVVAKAGAHVCLMHMQGEPRTMQRDPHYDDVVKEVRAFLLSRCEAVVASGAGPDRVWIDPGIGFGKTPLHNLTLLAGVGRLADLGFPVVVGASRKSFLKVFGGGETPDERSAATIAAHSLAQWNGASVLRVHDVVEAKRACALVAALICADNDAVTC